MVFKHFLLTRFNLKKDPNDPINYAWLEDRFEMFNKFCLPSVTSQTNQNFEWLVFFDSDTNKEYRDKIKQIQIKHPIFNPIYIEGARMYNSSVISEVKARLSSVQEYVITSRIDNDDAFRKDYISSIQEQFDHQTYCYIDVVKGLSLFYKKKLMLASIRKSFNPFSSLIEKNTADITTVSTRNHDFWAKEKNKIEIKNKTLWIQVIHGQNVANEFGHRGYLVTGGYLVNNYGVLESDFNVTLGQENKISEFKRWFYNVKLFLEIKINTLMTYAKKSVKYCLNKF